MGEDFWKNTFNVIATAIGAGLTALLTILLGDLEKAGFGPEAINLLRVLALLCALLFLMLWKRNYDLLGAGGEPLGTDARRRYDDQRAALLADGRIGRIYEDWLTRALDAVDRFFEGRARDKGERPPFWTAPSYDKCLVLALLYPIVCLYVFWAISNHVGVGEMALGLEKTEHWWSRVLTLASMACLVAAYYKSAPAEGRRKKLLWGFARAVAALVAFAVAFAFANAGGVAMTLAIGIATAITITIAGAGPGAIAGAGAVAVAGAVSMAMAMAVATATAGGFAFAFAFAFAPAIAFAVAFMYALMIRRDKEDLFLVMFTLIMTLACFLCAYALASLPAWHDRAGPLLLFLSLLTLLNAPFDWLCLGMTRYLLRLGLAKSGWAPVFCGLADVAVSTVLVILLTMTLIFGVQLFDGLAGLRGAQPILPLGDIFAAIAKDEWDPKNWWVYALLLSTYLPSLANLMLGFVAVMRGFPGVAPALGRQMPEGQAVAPSERELMSLAMTAQNAVGITLGAIALYGIVAGVFGRLLPWWFEFEIFDIAGEFESANYAKKLIDLFVARP